MKLGQTEILFQNGVDNNSGQALHAAKMICGEEQEVTLPYVMVPGLGDVEDQDGERTRVRRGKGAYRCRVILCCSALFWTLACGSFCCWWRCSCC